jgi:hypothetical protein
MQNLAALAIAPLSGLERKQQNTDLTERLKRATDPKTKKASA